MPLGDLSLRPAVGYAMHRLFIGEDYETISARLERSPDFGHLTQAERSAVIAEAATNVIATRAAQGEAGNKLIADAYNRPFGASETIGVRVLLTTVDSQGREHTPSVTINALPGSSLADLRSAAIDYWNVAHKANEGDDTPGTTATAAAIGALIIGGLESPALTQAVKP